jgi:phage FluMu protein Com
METVQLQCGNCGKVMAISTEHLGGQVRCPHCQSVVQTPPRQQLAPTPAPIPTEILVPRLESGEGDSIFAPEEPSDDLFGARPQQSHIEMPPENPPQPSQYTAETPVGDAPAQTLDRVGLFAGPPLTEAGSTDDAAAQLSTLRRPRPVIDRSYVSLMAFMFLIPYCVLSTAIVVYLMYQLARQPHPLDFLPDPVKDKGKGGPHEVERIKHDQPLAAHQKVALGTAITIGALEVRPLEVDTDEFGDLRLVLHVKNVSKNQAFSPMHPNFLKITKGAKISMPYSFVDSAKFNRIYDERVEFKRGADDKLDDDGELRPGQEEEIRLTTKENKEVVKNIVDSSENVTWRVQLRRGLVDHRGQKVSATAVIGVQFNAKAIKRG